MEYKEITSIIKYSAPFFNRTKKKDKEDWLQQLPRDLSIAKAA